MDIIEPVFHPEVKQIRNKDVSQEKDYCREVKRLKEDNSYSNMLPDSLYIHLYNGWKSSSWNKRLHGRVPVLLYNHPQTNTLLLEWYNLPKLCMAPQVWRRGLWPQDLVNIFTDFYRLSWFLQREIYRIVFLLHIFMNWAVLINS